MRILYRTRPGRRKERNHLVQELERDFTAAFGGDFEIVAAGLEQMDGGEYWLAAVRAKSSGRFSLRHQFEQPRSYRFHDDEIRVVVLERGQARQLMHDAPGQLLCVGDVLLVPIPLPVGASRHRFLSTSRFGEYFDGEFAGRNFRRADRPRMYGPLRYVGKQMQVAVHRGGTRATLGFQAFFEAAEPGRCNVQLSSVAPPALDHDGTESMQNVSVSVVIVEAVDPVTTLAASISTHAYDKPGQVSTGWSGFPTSVVMLRPGDRFRIAYGGRTVTPHEATGPLAEEVTPRVEIAPFAVARQPVWNAWIGRGITTRF